MSEIPDANLIAAVKSAATLYALDSSLVCAIIEQESAWNTWLNRYEMEFEASPKYGNAVRAQAYDFAAECLSKHGYDTTWSTEVKNRCTSWGLMQVLGQPARERGFFNPIPCLCGVATGLDVGCHLFKKKLAAASGDVRRALLDWNGGSDPEYPDKVLARVHKYE